MSTATRLTDARATATTLRRAGFTATKSSAGRIRGAANVTSGFKCERYIPLGEKRAVVKVRWVNDWARAAAGRAADPAAKINDMADALIAAGHTVVRVGREELHVWQEATA